MINNNLTFRNQRYPVDYPAFNDRSFLDHTWIENNPDSTFCDLISPTNDLAYMMLNMFPNPAKNRFTLEWRADLYTKIEVIDIKGRQMLSFSATGGRKYIDVSEWRDGVYFIRVAGRAVRKLVVRR